MSEAAVLDLDIMAAWFCGSWLLTALRLCGLVFSLSPKTNFALSPKPICRGQLWRLHQRLAKITCQSHMVLQFPICLSTIGIC